MTNINDAVWYEAVEYGNADVVIDMLVWDTNQVVLTEGNLN